MRQSATRTCFAGSSCARFLSSPDKDACRTIFPIDKCFVESQEALKARNSCGIARVAVVVGSEQVANPNTTGNGLTLRRNATVVFFCSAEHRPSKNTRPQRRAHHKQTKPPHPAQHNFNDLAHARQQYASFRPPHLQVAVGKIQPRRRRELRQQFAQTSRRHGPLVAAAGAAVAVRHTSCSSSVPIGVGRVRRSLPASPSHVPLIRPA